MKRGVLLVVLLAGCAAPLESDDVAVAPAPYGSCDVVAVETLVWADQLDPYLEAGFYVKAAPSGPTGSEIINQGHLMLLDAQCGERAFSLTGIRVEQTVREDITHAVQYYIIESNNVGMAQDVEGAVRAQAGRVGTASMDGPFGHTLRVVGATGSGGTRSMIFWDGQAPWLLEAEAASLSGASECTFAMASAFREASGAWYPCAHAVGFTAGLENLRLAPLNQTVPLTNG